MKLYYLCFDDIIITVYFQHVSSVAGDGAASSIEVSRTVTLHLCITDHRLLTFNGITRVMNATEGLQKLPCIMMI